MLGVELGWLEGVTTAKSVRRLPVVLTEEEVRALFAQLKGLHWLLASLLYGAGLRLMEAVRLRVKDIDFARREIVVRDGKGGKDRVTVLPAKLVEPLRQQLARARELHSSDCLAGYGEVYLPFALAQEVSACPAGVGLAVRVSRDDAFRGSALRAHAPSPLRRDRQCSAR